MKGSNRYSKSTKKKAIDTEKDPYLSKLKPGGNAVCKKCGTFYHNKRWSLAEDFDVSKLAHKEFEKILCPACQKIKDDFAGGYVTLSGEFLREHRDEIINLVKNKETLAMKKNPLERIITIKRKRGGVTEITTTTDKFAQRLGQILKKAFGGEVEYKWSDDVKLARVNWER